MEKNCCHMLWLLAVSVEQFSDHASDLDYSVLHICIYTEFSSASSELLSFYSLFQIATDSKKNVSPARKVQGSNF